MYMQSRRGDCKCRLFYIRMPETEVPLILLSITLIVISDTILHHCLLKSYLSLRQRSLILSASLSNLWHETAVQGRRASWYGWLKIIYNFWLWCVTISCMQECTFLKMSQIILLNWVYLHVNARYILYNLW